MLLQLLGRRDFLDNDTAGGDRPRVSVTTVLVPMATVSNHQSDPNGPLANPFTVSSDLTVLVKVEAGFAIVIIDNFNRVDRDWFGTFHAIKGNIPTLTATQAVSYPEIAVKLDLQRCVDLLFDEDTILSKEKARKY